MLAFDYKETQHFQTKAVLIFLLFITGLFTYGTFQQIKNSSLLGEGYEFDLAMLLGTFILILLALMFLLARLEIKINDRGIYYRFYPFQVIDKFIPWDNIRNAYIREFESTAGKIPVGIKFGENQQVLNVKGTHLLKIELENGKQVILGTANPQGLRRTLVDYGKSI